MQAGRELDALVAEKVMGLDLKPHRDVAMVVVGARRVVSTGPTFMLNNGREIPMPNGEQLRAPKGLTNWNDRYFLHVAEVLGDEIAAEVDAFRLEPRPYSTGIAAAWEVVEKMRAEGFVWEIGHCIPLSLPPYGASFIERSQTVKDYEVNRDMIERAFVMADTAPLAICMAALKAIEARAE